MKSKKIIIATFSTLSISTILGGVISGAVYASKINNSNLINNINTNSAVMFDNKQFSNVNEAYNYALSLVKNEEFNVANQKLYSLTIDNATHVFDSSSELNNFISSKIKLIPNASTNVLFHNLNEDKSIPLNEVYKYNINTANDSIFNDNVTTIYKRADGSFFAGGKEQQDKAKESYLEIHKGYNFNGIFFKTKQDLEIYLQKIYSKQIPGNKWNTDSNDFKKIIIKDEKGNIVSTSDSIYMKDNSNIDYVSNFLYSNSYKYLKISGQDDVYLKFNKYTNSIEGNLGEEIKMKDLPVLKKVSTDNKSLYVVDANINEKYNLYGPYFLKTDGNITNITNPDLWEKSDDSPEQIIKSESINILAGLFDLLLTGPINNLKTDSSGNAYRIWNSNEPLFYISSLSETNDINDSFLYQKEQKMFDALKSVKTDNQNNNLFKDFIEMYNNLINTKNYSTVYAIPTIYNYIIDNLIYYNANVETVIIVKEYFETLCDFIQQLLESIFGDLLLSYDGLKRFNFAEYFQINQYGNDGTNLNGILNGYDLIKNYKGLIAGCYVLIKAIGNSQNILQIKYKVKDDINLFKLLADGTNSDQVTAEQILNNWNKDIQGSNISIIDQLQSIYDTFSEWGTNISQLVVDDLEKNKLTDNLNDKFLNIENAINKTIKNNNCMDKNSESKFIELQQILNVKPELILDNNNRAKKTYIKIFITNSYIEKTNLNLKTKLESIHETKSFIEGKNSILNNKDGIFKNQFAFGKREEIKKNLSKSLSISSEQDILKTSSIMIEIQKTNKPDLMEKFKIGEIIAGEVGKIMNSISDIINNVNNSYFDDVQDQLIAAGVMKICASICNIASEVTPPPFNVIVRAVGIVFSFISAAIGEAEQVIYEYKVNDSANTKYYWDGGLVMNRFWGIWKDTQRSIKDLKMQSPIELINSSNSDVIYFNTETYSDDDDDMVRKNVLKYLLNNNLVSTDTNKKYSWVYSIEPNVNNVNSSNSYNNIQDLANYIIENNINLIDIGNELFIDGYKFSSEEVFLNEMKTKILDKIQPIYIAKIPELDENGYPLETQSTFHMPFPYYEPFYQEDKSLVCQIKNGEYITMDPKKWRYNDTEINCNNESIQPQIIQNQKYISYNTNKTDINAQSTYTPTINNIYKYIKEIFLQSINVESKVVLKSSLYSNSNQNFDKFDSSIFNLDIYLVELIPGVKKYFINRNDAVEYILKTSTNNGSLLLDMYIKQILTYTLSNGEKLYFNNKDQFNKWFISNVQQGGK